MKGSPFRGGLPFTVSPIFPATLPSVSYERLQVIRAAALVLGGFAALCIAAFLFSPIAGWIVVGASLLTVEFLTNPDAGKALADARARGER